MNTIQVKARDAKNSSAFLRKNGQLPAVFYGAGQKTTSIVLDERDFEKILKKAGESTTVTLKSDGGEISSLIHDIQRDPVNGKPIHVDFLAIDVNKVIRVGVPLEFIGNSNAIKAGGILVKVLHEIEIEALPKDLPQKIEVDISKLVTAEDNVLVSDLIMPTGVKAITKEIEVVAAISIPQEEKAEESAPADLSAIEVEKKGKKEEEAIPEA